MSESHDDTPSPAETDETGGAPPPEAAAESREAAAEAPSKDAAAAEPEAAPEEAPATDVAVAAAATPEDAGAEPEAAPGAAPATAGEAEPEAASAEAAAEPAPEASAPREPVPMPTDPVSLRLLEALERATPVQGKVFGWNQGGYHVLIDGLLAFCPRSEIDLGTPKAPKKYIEKTYRFHVLEHRPQGNRFVLSRVKILEEERERQAARTREKVQAGAELEGSVRSLTTFGAFVDLGGGIEGLVHVSELSHRAVSRPGEVVKKGQRVKVKVLKVEEEGKRISLSIKALAPDPWKAFTAAHPRGTPFAGKVTGKTEFGAFVEVEPGIEGLVHVSALPPGKTLEDEAFEPGKELSGWVKEVDSKRRRISLSLRPVPTSDPWQGIEKRYPEGDVVTGTVEEIAPFGVFVNLEPGLTGLMPTSELKLPRGTHAGRVYPPGSEVKVQVGRIEPKRKRISLLPEGAAVEGSRTDLQDFKKRAAEQVGSGMPTLAAAFEKLKRQKGESA